MSIQFRGLFGSSTQTPTDSGPNGHTLAPGDPKYQPQNTNNHGLPGQRPLDGPKDTNNRGTFASKQNADSQPRDTDGYVAVPEPSNSQEVVETTRYATTLGTLALRKSDSQGSLISYFDPHATIANLVKDVLNLMEEMDEIHRSFRRSDGLGISKQRTKFKPWLNILSVSRRYGEWGRIRKELEELLWDTRKLATTVVTTIEDFRMEITPLFQSASVSFVQKKKKLARFLEDAKKTEKSTQDIAQQVVTIQKKLYEFQIEYGSDIRNVSGSDATKEMNSTDERIRVLNFQIDALTQRINDRTSLHAKACRVLSDTVSIKFDDPLENALMVAILTLLGPVGCVSFVFDTRKIDSNLATTPSWSEMAHMQNDFNNRVAELKELESDTTNLQDLIPGRVKVAECRAKDVCERLNGIAKIWMTVQTNAQIFQSYLKDTETSPNHVPVAEVQPHREPAREVESLPNQVSNDTPNLTQHPRKSDNDTLNQRLHTLLLEGQKSMPPYESLEAALLHYANTAA